MAAAAEELSKNIRDQFLQCKICLDGLKSPKTLPCLHTFCADCIIYYVESNCIDGRKFACPICRRHIYIPKNGIDGFPDSFFVQSLNDCITQSQGATPSVRGSNQCGICKFKEPGKEASSSCVECRIELCEECASSHTSAKVTQGHTLVPLSQPGMSHRDTTCRVHRGESIQYYCENCNSPVCLPCTFLEHKGHDIEEIGQVRGKFSQEMEGLVLQSEDNILQLQSARDDLTELENELFLRKEEIKTNIRRTIQDLIRKVNDQETRLMLEIDTFYDTLTLGRDRQKIERTIFRLQTAHDFAKQLLSADTSPIAQLVNRNEAKGNLQQSLSYELPDIMQYATMLDRFVVYLPGQLSVDLGSLLSCAGQPESMTGSVTQLRQVLPSTKAVFLHSLSLQQSAGSDTPAPADPGTTVLGLEFLPNGDLVVLQSQGKKVRIFSRQGQLRVEFGDESELLHPSDLCVTRDSEIAVADCGHRCVKIYDQLGTPRGTFGGDDVLGLPLCLTLDDLGRYLVCDQAKGRLTLHRQHGELLDEHEIQNVEHPQYLVHASDKLFICDSDKNNISMYSYTKDGVQMISKLCASSCDVGEFLDCSGIAHDHRGNLLISDGCLNRIHMLNARGELSTVRASGRALLHPTCLAVSKDGILAVATQQSGSSLDDDHPPRCGVSLYRLIKTEA